MLRPIEDSVLLQQVKEKTNWNASNLLQARKRIKKYLMDICDYKCFFCRTKLEVSEMTIEHIVCKNDYEIFAYKPENLILCCSKCNSLKNDINVFSNTVNEVKIKKWDDYPLESSEYKIIHPYIDEYEDCILKERIKYIAKNSKGVETILAYKLYRISLAEKNSREANKNEEIEKLSAIEREIEEFIDGLLNNERRVEPNEISSKFKYLKLIRDQILTIKNSSINPVFNEISDYLMCKLGDNKNEKLSNVAIQTLDEMESEISDRLVKIFLEDFNMEEMNELEIDGVLNILNVYSELFNTPQKRRDIAIILSYDINKAYEFFCNKEFINSGNIYINRSIKLLELLTIIKDVDHTTVEGIEELTKKILAFKNSKLVVCI